MNIRDLAEKVGYRLPTRSEEKALRTAVVAVSAESRSDRILACSELIKSQTGADLYWEEVAAFERGAGLKVILERRFSTWNDITKPVTGSSKRSYSANPTRNSGTSATEYNQTKLAQVWARVREKEARATPAAVPPPADPALKKIEEHLRLANAMKALDMPSKGRELGEQFRDMF